MDTPLFHNARLKIKRANQHIRELQTAIDAFLHSDFYRVDIEHDPQARHKALTFEMIRPVPEDIPLYIGDAMHNLRTVLDYMAFEIVTRAGGTTDYVKFPVRQDRKELEAALTGGEMKVAGSDIIDLICDVVQPYPGGNGAALGVLHSLDITDKHYQPVPIVTPVSVTFNGRVDTNLFRGISFRVSPTAGELGRIRKMNLMGMDPDMTFEGDVQLTFAVLFGKGQPFEGQPVVPPLHQLSQLVAGTLQAVEQVYLAREKARIHNDAAPPESHPPTP